MIRSKNEIDSRLSIIGAITAEREQTDLSVCIDINIGPEISFHNLRQSMVLADTCESNHAPKRRHSLTY
jgi:hypothetical protein